MSNPTQDLLWRKKPVVIEAFQMTKDRRMDNREWPAWLNEAWNKHENEPGALFRQNMNAEMPDLLCIHTLEGLHLVGWGDWIIRGVKGELYPCKPDVFEATYERATAPPAPAQPYSIDEDAQGIRKRVAHAITGALAFGAQGINQPPEGHWLNEFWSMAMAERTAPAQAAEPVAFLVRGYCEKGKLYAGVLHQDVENAKRTASEFAKHYPTVKTVGLYTHPAPVALTDEQLWQMRADAKADPRCVDEHWFILFARAIEAAHGIKGAA